MVIYIQRLRYTDNTHPRKKKEETPMKRTKSMIYIESAEATELFLYTVNHADLYRRMIVPVIQNLQKKATKGIYNADKAVDLWYNVANEASKLYNKDFGYMFTVTERFTVATKLEAYFEDEVFENIN